MRKNLKDPVASQIGLYDEDLERKILASCLRSDDKAEVVAATLTPSAFSSIERLVMFRSIFDLRRKNESITVPAIVAQARVVCGELRENIGLVTKEIVLEYSGMDLADFDFHGGIETLKRLESSRMATSIVDEIVSLAATRPDPEVMRQQLSRIIVNTLTGIASNNILYGWDAQAQMDAIVEQNIEDRRKGIKRPIPHWPWEAMRAIATPLYPGLVGYIGAADGIGKSTIAEICSEYWTSKCGLKIAYFHTEYTHDFMLMRRTARWSGIDVAKLMHGHNETAYLDTKELRLYKRAKEFIGDTMNHLHYVYAGGRTMKEIVADLWVLRQAGEVDGIVVDYFHDLLFENQRGGLQYLVMGDDMKMLHRTLGQDAMKIFGLVVMRANKVAITAEQLDRSMIEGGSALVNKAQLTALFMRKTLDAEGQDDVEANAEKGIIDKVRSGEAGEMSKMIYGTIAKQTAGKMGNFRLWMPAGMVITDVPPELGGPPRVRPVQQSNLL